MVKKRIEAGVAQRRFVQFSGANLVTRNEVSETAPEACRAKLRGVKRELINGSMIPKERSITIEQTPVYSEKPPIDPIITS
jgi:hypothetical protein